MRPQPDEGTMTETGMKAVSMLLAKDKPQKRGGQVRPLAIKGQTVPDLPVSVTGEVQRVRSQMAGCPGWMGVMQGTDC